MVLHRFKLAFILASQNSYKVNSGHWLHLVRSHGTDSLYRAWTEVETKIVHLRQWRACIPSVEVMFSLIQALTNMKVKDLGRTTSTYNVPPLDLDLSKWLGDSLKEWVLQDESFGQSESSKTRIENCETRYATLNCQVTDNRDQVFNQACTRNLYEGNRRPAITVDLMKMKRGDIQSGLSLEYRHF